MAGKRTAPWKFRIAIAVLLALACLPAQRTLADGDPHRQQAIEITYTEYTWWLLHWQTDGLACELQIDHPEEPTGSEVFLQCGEKIFQGWQESAPCQESASEEASTCSGMYLYLVGAEQKTREIMVELPIPEVRVELKDCISVRGSDLCAELPSLLITAREPLPNESITKVQGSINTIPFLCFDDSCELALRETGEEGVALVFWADSSFGDSTRHYLGRIRVVRSGDEIPYTDGWRIDIVSDRVDLNNVRGCAKIWQSFPPLGTPPDWLASPPHPYLLQTDVPYTYLAGQLIQRGYVEADHCSDFGLTEDGYASQCGLQAARELVTIWQNTFNGHIMEISEETGIPARLLKRIFAKESQFWPETTDNLYQEYGFGHTNELGADTTLLWNKDFYDEFCPLILAQSVCQQGYAMLDDWDRTMLRGALLAEMEVNLPYHPQSVNPEQIRSSLYLFSETLQGNCSQVKQMIYNELDRVPGEVASYEDLWRFTLVNYHGGAGCLSEAIIEVSDQGKQLTWLNISESLESICPYALDYVRDITR